MCYTLAAADGSFVHAESLPALISRLPECGLQEGGDGESSGSSSSSSSSSSDGDGDMDAGEAAPRQEGGVEWEGGAPRQLEGGVEIEDRMTISQMEGGDKCFMDVMAVTLPAAQVVPDQLQQCVPMEGVVQAVHWPWPGERRGSLPLPFPAQHPAPSNSHPTAPPAFQPQPYARLMQLSLGLPADDPGGVRACLSSLHRDSFPSLIHLALLGPEGWPLRLVWEEETEEAQPPPKWSTVWGTGVTQPLPTWPSWWGDEAVEHQPLLQAWPPSSSAWQTERPPLGVPMRTSPAAAAAAAQPCSLGVRGPAAAALLDLPLLQTLVLSNVELRLRPGRPTLEPLLHLTGLSHLSYRLVSVGPAPPPAWRAPAAPDGNPNNGGGTRLWSISLCCRHGPPPPRRGRRSARLLGCQCGPPQLLLLLLPSHAPWG